MNQHDSWRMLSRVDMTKHRFLFDSLSTVVKVNDTIEQIKQSEDYEQLKDFIDAKFYDKTEPRASALGMMASVFALSFAFLWILFK